MQTQREQSTGADSLVERARSLVDGIRARVEQTERDRCVPPETIEEFKQTGLVRALQAKRFGGLECPPHEFYPAVVEIGAACGS
ncbi:MAG TPA: flavin-dependent monooxygenase, partial [Dehalococcoidia bacterium]|nr:flavin-dependent monooxygenase [Dehalococcoidia bacterium]